MRVGPYLVEGLLGRGGMGTVHRARHQVIGALVAMKELTHPDKAARALMVEEARLLFGLKHQSFPTVLDLLEQDGRTFLVMDYVPGPTLTQVLEAGVLGASEACVLGTGLCRALEFLHGRGVLHRDIKPDNIILPRGLTDPVLVDLGIAAHAGQGGAAAFTPGMAPPEQVSGAVCTVATDLYQVGATLLWAATGQPPPEALGRTHDDDLGAGAAALNALAPPLPAAVRWAMRLRPPDRPASSAQLAAALTGPARPAASAWPAAAADPAPPRRGLLDIRR